MLAVKLTRMAFDLIDCEVQQAEATFRLLCLSRSGGLRIILANARRNLDT